MTHRTKGEELYAENVAAEQQAIKQRRATQPAAVSMNGSTGLEQASPHKTKAKALAKDLAPPGATAVVLSVREIPRSDTEDTRDVRDAVVRFTGDARALEHLQERLSSDGLAQSGVSSVDVGGSAPAADGQISVDITLRFTA